jgi:hypothetical protein
MMMDNDFPVALGGVTPQGFLQSYTSGFNDYSQAGTNIPAMRLQNKYGQVGGRPLYDETTIAGSPSFDLKYPMMPIKGASGEQSIEGIPNATPEMIRRYVDRKRVNPGGQTLPPFV